MNSLVTHPVHGTAPGTVRGATPTLPPRRPLRLGTRRSPLALAQSGAVAARLRELLGRPVEVVRVVTEGDRSSAALTAIGGTGVFVTALRDALLAGTVDVAVHSFKDLPTSPAPGLVVAAVPAREDPRDCLVCPAGLTLAELPVGSRVGTGSPRRAAQLRALGLGLEVVAVRGNVDTRIGVAKGGTLDAVVLARAGLVRLGRLDEVTETLDPLLLMPAPGQGALAVEARDGSASSGGEDTALVAAVRDALDDPVTRACVAAERALLGALEAGCSAPVGALADWAEGESGGVDHAELYLRAVVAAADGSEDLRRSATGPAGHPEQLGRDLAAHLLRDGAGALMGTGPTTADTTAGSRAGMTVGAA